LQPSLPTFARLEFGAEDVTLENAAMPGLARSGAALSDAASGTAD
jgi:hypothetical protein